MSRVREEEERHRTIRREISPPGRVSIDVDLYDVAQAFDGYYAPPRDIEPVYDWIEAGFATLEVVSVNHAIVSAAWRRREHYERGASGRSQEHRRLCALGAIYIESIGGCPDLTSCDYPVGRADVAAVDRSLVIECGTMRTDKLAAALERKQKLMILPYSDGGAFDDAQVNGLWWKPFVDEHGGDSAAVRRWSIVLGYIFTPIAVPDTRLRLQRESDAAAMRKVKLW